MHVGHAEFFFLRLVVFLALVVDVGLSHLVFEEPFVVVPRAFGWAIRQTRQVFLVCNRLTATKGSFGEQRKVETLDRLAAFDREVGSDAAFILEAGDFMATCAAKVAYPLLTFLLQLRIIHVGSVGVGRRIFVLLGDQVAGDVLRVFYAQAQARHHRHVLHLQLVAVVGASAVLEIEDVRQTFFRVVLGADVFFL